MATKNVFNGFAAEFPERLRLLMKARGVRQHELSAALGLKTRQSITGYLDGSVLPPIDKILGIADFFNISVDWLLCRPGATMTTESEVKAACEALKLTEEAITALQAVAALPCPAPASKKPIEALSCFISNEGIQSFSITLARLYGNAGQGKLSGDVRMELKNISKELSERYGREIEVAPISGRSLQVEAEATAKGMIADIYEGEA